MPWYLWMVAGAATLVALTAVLIWVIGVLDDRAIAKRTAVRSTQAQAEARMQQTVQDTIQQLFDATRNYQ